MQPPSWSCSKSNSQQRLTKRKAEHPQAHGQAVSYPPSTSRTTSCPLLLYPPFYPSLHFPRLSLVSLPCLSTSTALAPIRTPVRRTHININITRDRTHSIPIPTNNNRKRCMPRRRRRDGVEP
ncbi:hypothetical protein CVT25_011762 [Psilocybe cyanescens]|uniref:Uncharacterized protein n=1 Tax=Psilocybe cyanescens TaxID=93625 RepID=A0A409W1K0_PSICY|nr:hypothetical protein CVT25_011762 [Psilocybe cyanescens]